MGLSTTKTVNIGYSLRHLGGRSSYYRIIKKLAHTPNPHGKKTLNVIDRFELAAISSKDRGSRFKPTGRELADFVSKHPFIANHFESQLSKDRLLKRGLEVLTGIDHELKPKERHHMAEVAVNALRLGLKTLFENYEVNVDHLDCATLGEEAQLLAQAGLHHESAKMVQLIGRITNPDKVTLLLPVHPCDKFKFTGHETPNDWMRFAHKWAEIAYADKVRKDTGEPYMKHPERVAGMVRRMGGDWIAIAAAYLHDILEDTGFSLEGFPQEIIDTVELVSHRENESKETSLKRLIKANNERAALVKVSDRLHNFRGGLRTRGLKWATEYLETTLLVLKAANNVGLSTYPVYKALETLVAYVQRKNGKKHTTPKDQYLEWCTPFIVVGYLPIDGSIKSQSLVFSLGDQRRDTVHVSWSTKEVHIQFKKNNRPTGKKTFTVNEDPKIIEEWIYNRGAIVRNDRRSKDARVRHPIQIQAD